MLSLICVVLLVLWLTGNFAPFSPVRGNNAVHILVVLVVLILLYQLLGGGLHLRRW
jgi:hypothetical protein